MQTFNKPKYAVLKRFALRLCDGKEVVMSNVKVVKDSQRHIVHLIGNPVQIDLIRVKKDERLKTREGVRLVNIEGTKRWFKVRDIVWGQYTSERCEVYAYSNDIGLGGVAVAELPAFIERLLM